jgi:hypothetical protein
MNITGKFFGLFLLIVTTTAAEAQPPLRQLIFSLNFNGQLADYKANIVPDKTIRAGFGPSRDKLPESALSIKRGTLLSYRDSNDSLSFRQTDQISYSFWVMPVKHRSDSATVILSKNYHPGSKGPGYAFLYDKSRSLSVAFRFGNKKKQEVLLSSKAKLETGKWNHLIVSMEPGKNLAITVNNRADTSTMLPPMQGNSADSSLFVGSYSNGSCAFEGLMDDLRAYRKIVSTQETDYLFMEGTNFNHLEVGLNNPNSTSNTATLKIGVMPTGDQIALNINKYKKMEGYRIVILNRKGKPVDEFRVEQEDNFFNYDKWGGAGTYFLQLYDPEQDLINTFRITIK